MARLSVDEVTPDGLRRELELELVKLEPLGPLGFELLESEFESPSGRPLSLELSDKQPMRDTQTWHNSRVALLDGLKSGRTIDVEVFVHSCHFKYNSLKGAF